MIRSGKEHEEVVHSVQTISTLWLGSALALASVVHSVQTISTLWRMAIPHHRAQRRLYDDFFFFLRRHLCESGPVIGDVEICEDNLEHEEVHDHVEDD